MRAHIINVYCTLVLFYRIWKIIWLGPVILEAYSCAFCFPGLLLIAALIDWKGRSWPETEGPYRIVPSGVRKKKKKAFGKIQGHFGVYIMYILARNI